MSPMLVFWILLQGLPVVEQAPAPRPVQERAFDRYLKSLRAEQGPTSPLSRFEELRANHLYMIALLRRTYTENIDLFEKAQAWTKSPERKERYRSVVEDLRQRVRALDEDERRCREDGPPLPTVELPPRQ